MMFQTFIHKESRLETSSFRVDSVFCYPLQGTSSGLNLRLQINAVSNPEWKIVPFIHGCSKFPSRNTISCLYFLHLNISQMLIITVDNKLAILLEMRGNLRLCSLCFSLLSNWHGKLDKLNLGFYHFWTNQKNKCYRSSLKSDK